MKELEDHTKDMRQTVNPARIFIEIIKTFQVYLFSSKKIKDQD